MRVEWAVDIQGRIQFIIYAETREERIVLKQFSRECQQADIQLHGMTYEGGAWAPSSFNFGSREVIQVKIE